MALVRLRKLALRSAFGDKRGTIAVVWALTFTMAMTTVGAAIDFWRWHNASEITAAAIDSAVLAGGLSLQVNPTDTAGAKAVARRTYAASIAKRVSALSDTVDFTVGTGGQGLSAGGTAKIATSVLSVFGIPELGIVSNSGARAEVTTGGPGGSNLEVAAMLDVTGSMCDDGAGPCTAGVKIDALKAATTRLIDIVVRPDQSVTTTKIALVPFSTRIRLASDDSAAGLMKSLTNMDTPLSFWYSYCDNWVSGGGSETDLPPGHCAGANVTTQAANWHLNPCVTERFNKTANVFDVSDDAPGPGKWLSAHNGNRMPLSWDSADTAPTSGLGGSAADSMGDPWQYSTTAGTCADIFPGNEVVPLTSDKTALLGRVGTLQAYGGTAGALATSWTWYMLSPNWSGIWSGVSTPAPYSDMTTHNANGAPKLRKVVVIETDGGFNTLLGNKDQNQQTISNYAISVCSAMKAKGIEIYTVGFMLNSLPAAEASIARATLQACGTDVEHFYDTLNAGDLQTAFNGIGVKLSGLRLMQ